MGSVVIAVVEPVGGGLGFGFGCRGRVLSIPRWGGMDGSFLTSICSNSPGLPPFIPNQTGPGRGFEGLAGQRVAFPQTQYPVAAEDAADRPLRHPRKRRQPSGPRPQPPPRP